MPEDSTAAPTGYPLCTLSDGSIVVEPMRPPRPSAFWSQVAATASASVTARSPPSTAPPATGPASPSTLGLSSPAAGADPATPSRAAPSPSPSHTLVFRGGHSAECRLEVKLDEYGSDHRSMVMERTHHGLLGVHDLGFAKYLFYVSSARVVAEVAGARIYRADTVDAVPVQAAMYRSMAEEQWEAASVARLLHFFNEFHFFYSREMDLTRSLQSQLDSPRAAPPTATASLLASNWDFLINRELLAAPLAQFPNHLGHFFVGLIAGSVGHSVARLPSSLGMTATAAAVAAPSTLTTTVISRVHTRRVGRRYYSRGMAPVTVATRRRGSRTSTSSSDPLPSAASDSAAAALTGCSNAAETETLLVVSTPTSSAPSAVSSHLQWRGSVPLVWTQAPEDMEWKPRVHVAALHSAADPSPLTRYLRAWAPLVPRSATVVVLDLLDRGYTVERALSETFEQACREYAAEAEMREDAGRDGGVSVEYHNLPICDRRRHCYAAAQKVLDGHAAITTATTVLRRAAAVAAKDARRPSETVAAALSTPPATPPPSPPAPLALIESQSAVVRTNCLDSTDRTNLTQYMLAEVALEHQLASLGLPPHLHAALLPSLQTLWIAHGHALAKLYVGTDAVHQHLIRPPPPTPSPAGGKRSSLTCMAAAWRAEWATAATLLRRQYCNHFVDPLVQDAAEELLAPRRPSPSTAATSTIAPHLALQRRLSMAECDLPVAGFAFVFLRKHLAPVRVDGLPRLALCFVWMSAARVVRWWLGGAQGMFRRPRSMAAAAVSPGGRGSRP
ncbi:hypothetical protein H9P43_004387 [Blastocladiella emersonii ATCC 22665]|nr:hypothetical protein H9P43_004387 [Blastocladiella emersonii ATCC 22665]